MTSCLVRSTSEKSNVVESYLKYFFSGADDLFGGKNNLENLSFRGKLASRKNAMW
jgi:hypothetical protein